MNKLTYYYTIHNFVQSQLRRQKVDQAQLFEFEIIRQYLDSYMLRFVNYSQFRMISKVKTFDFVVRYENFGYFPYMQSAFQKNK